MAEVDTLHQPRVAPPDEQPDLAHFERAVEFKGILDEVLSQDDAADSAKDKQLTQLATILDEYQEQSYLLDPHLEGMVSPPVSILQAAIRNHDNRRGSVLASTRIHRIARLLYLYTKVRGYKTIARFFPHQVSDVVPTLAALERLRITHQSNADHDANANANANANATQWHLRYILLLWLSLVCMIPFDLDQFKVGDGAATTTSRTVDICQSFLDSPGKERDAAAVTLGKLFQRRDASQRHFPAFLTWAQGKLLLANEPTSPRAVPSAFVATGILHTLCEVLKTATPDVVLPHLAQIQTILSLGDPDHGCCASPDDMALARLRNNSLVNKYRSKLAARMGLKVLRPRHNGRGVVRRQLDPQGGAQTQATTTSLADLDDADVPESIDDYIAQLLNGLSDKDTIVRYSSAKGLARICERLPATFIDQVAEAVTALFRVNILPTRDGGYDLSAASEYTWQGACFALAELGRRGLLNADQLADPLEYTRHALFFDIRRGSHSIGSAVRDAACYVLWALARAYSPDAIRPHALALARSLAAVSLLDRDVSVRRAASAAFQECVGRLGLFPHGIDIIPKTDFFSIGVRRNAFLQCCPAVARHEEYRMCLLDHLLTTTIVHWDPSMRELGAQAVAKVAELDLHRHAPHVIRRLSPNCKSRDTFILHGSLLTLAEVGAVCGRSFSEAALSTQVSIFSLLDDVPRHAIRSLAGNGQILSAACHLIASSASARALAEEHTPATPAWDAFVEAALSHREESAHRAAAEALHAISHLRDCADRIQRAMDGWKTLPAAQQQGFALALGSMRFNGEGAPTPTPTPTLLPRALRFLITLVQPNSPSYASQIETRRNAVTSLVSALLLLGPALPSRVDAALGREIFAALVHSLEDYTTDRRGDVGSWVRAAALRGLRDVLGLYRRLAAEETQGFVVLEWMPQGLCDDAMAGIAKQMVERIDSLRAEAAGIFLQQYAPGAVLEGRELPRPRGAGIVRAQFHGAFPTGTERQGMGPTAGEGPGPVTHDAPDLRSPSYLFPRAMHLLRIGRYRPAVLRGILHALGTNTELSHRYVGPALVRFVLGLGRGEGEPPAEAEPLTPLRLLSDLISLAEAHFRDSKLAVPALMALSVLLEGGVVDVLPLASAAAESKSGGAEAQAEEEASTRTYAVLCRALRLASRSLERIKSPARLSAHMKLGVDLLGVPPPPPSTAGSTIRSTILHSLLPAFLSHPYATLRAHTAEHLYVVLSSRGVVRLRRSGGDGDADVDGSADGSGEASEWEWEELELSEEAEGILLETNWAAEECDEDDEDDDEGEQGDDERAWLRRRARRLVAELE